MRLPSYNDLSEEQDAVCLRAPLDEPVLVAGPPGTGKTVVAWYRAQTLTARKNGAATLLMFNSVLKEYAKSGQESEFEVRTRDSWFPVWWDSLQLPVNAVPSADRIRLDVPKTDRDLAKQHGVRAEYSGKYFQYWWISRERYEQNPKLYAQWSPMPVLPRGEDQVEDGQVYWLDCPKSEKDDAKKLGARWHNDSTRWYVDPERYERAAQAFARWNPTLGGFASASARTDGYRPIRFDLVAQALVMGMPNALNRTPGWGHLILDEGQDFSPQFFEALRVARQMAISAKLGTPRDFGLTVFADENQRLHETHNSSLREIQQAVAADNKHVYILKRNYRNSRPIAALAQCFYAGVASGVPDLPARKGPRPVLLRIKSREAQLEAILRHYERHDDQEIGVITPNNESLDWFVSRLSDALDSGVVQAYRSRSSEFGDARKLRFDTPGHITVINVHSCKGLEFDAVFLPDLHRHQADTSNLDVFKMQMFVMISRAREHLTLMLQQPTDKPAAIERLIPPHAFELMEERVHA